MADGYFPTLISKDKDPNLVTNPVFVELTDGTAALGITAGALDVNLTNSSVAVTGTFWQATQPISGSVTVSNAAGGSAVNIQDGGNSITVDGTFWQATQPVSGTVTSDQGAAAAITAPWSVELSDGAAAIGVSGNPLFVTFTSAAVTGEVHDYLDTTTVNHDYTISNTMLLKGIEFSCSGGGKAEVQVGPIASLATKWVGFVPKHGGTVSVKFDPAIEVPNTSTGTIRVIRTNRESSAQDLYSTIIGIDA